MTYPSPGAPAGWYAPEAPQDVVVGEAVALHLRLAKLPSRALALMVDLAILAVLMLVVGGTVAAAAEGADDAAEAALVLGSVVLLIVGWPVTWETLTRGRSPGKMLLGLRVVRDDGGPIRFRHAFTRALTAVFVDFNPLLLGAVGVIVSLSSSKGKRVGDLLAGTVVVRERVPRASSAATYVAPHLAAWAAELPVTRVSDQLALQARQVLARRNELDPAQAHYWTDRIAQELLAELGAHPPAPSDPVSVLAAVLDERRNRDLARAGWTPGAPYGWQPQAPWPAQPPAWGGPPAPQAPWSDPAQGWSAPPQTMAPPPQHGAPQYAPPQYEGQLYGGQYADQYGAQYPPPGPPQPPQPAWPQPSQSAPPSPPVPPQSAAPAAPTPTAPPQSDGSDPDRTPPPAGGSFTAPS